MTKTMRILTFLLLMMVGAGQTWAMALEPSNIKRGTITGGSIAFYADEACTSDFESDVAANATVYVKATPEIGNTAIGVTFTAKKGISSDAMQAPRRSAEGPGIAADITVSAVTGKPGIYSFTMPDGENTNVTITASFAEPEQQLVSYVDENGETHTDVSAYVLDETMRVLPAGIYVVPNGLTLDHGIQSNSGSGIVTVIIPDGKTLAIGSANSPCSGDAFGMGASLCFYGQTNATGKLDINATGNGISIGGSVTVAHLDVDIVSKNSNGIGCSNGVTIIGCANGSNTVKVHSASTCISGGQKSVTIKYCDVDVVCEGSMIAIDCLASVTIEGVSTGAQVNTVNVRSAGDCIGTSNNPVTISYCNVEMTGTTQTDNVYDACGSSGITTSGGVVITGRTDANNTLKIRCGGKTSPNSYGIAGGQKAVSISRYNVNIVNENFYGIYTSDDVTITGGQVEITGGTKGAGIHSGNGIITLGWITPTDYIKASSYFVSDIKSMKTAEGQRFVAYDGDYATAVFSGSISGLDNTFIGNLAGKTLRPLDGNVFTKYVPQDKSGSYTIAIPALPNGGAYSFTKTDEGGIIANHSYDAEQNTLTYITNSGKTSGTTATITVAATGTNNNDDYSFTLNVVVSEYTTAYEWPEQTNIYLIGNDWAFYIRDGVERAYHDNELVWSESGITLNTSLITIKNGETISYKGYTAKVGENVLTAGENTLVLAPGVHRLEITGDDGKLDDWVDFKVIKLVEDDHFEFNVSNVINAAPEEAEAKGLRVTGGLTGEWTGDVVLKYNGEDVTNSKNTTIWYRGTGFYYDDEKINLYDNPTYRTPAVGMIGDDTSIRLDNVDPAKYSVYNVVNGSASLDGVSQISTVCGKLVWHGEGEEIKRKLDLDDMPISSGVDGGYVYYVGVDCPDFYLKEDGKVYYKDKTGEHLEAENKTYTDGKDIFYAGGVVIYQYGNFISYGSITFTADDDDPVALCENRKALGDIIGYCNCPKDADGNCTECFSQNGNTITICGETIEMGPYIVVGTNFILTGNRAIYNIVPSVEHKIAPTDFNTEINGSTISFLGHSINAGNRPIIKGDFWLGPQQVGGCGQFRPCAYARYETAPYCYAIARRDIDLEVRRSVVSIEDCKSEYKVGEDVDITISKCAYKYPDDTETYYGSTGIISVFLNNVYYKTLNGANSHDLCFSDLPAGTYKLKVVLDGDQGYQGSTTTTTFTVVRTDSKVTLTGKQNTAGEAFETGANIEYDPENPIVVNAVNDQTVSNTYWKWQISNTSDAGVVEIDNIVNKSENNAKNSEDISLNTVGLGTVTLKARFSGNNKYNPATGAITFTVVPKNVTSPIIELVDQSTIYYDGTAKEPAVKVYYAEGKEIPADQYDVTYANNTNGSTEDAKAKIIVKSKTGALYTIDAEKEFEIQETTLFAANSTNLWATFCSQNEYEVPEGCTAYTISSISGSTVMLSDALTSIPAYTPVLIQRSANVTVPVTAIYKAAGAAPASGYDAQTGLAAIPGTAFTFYGNCLRSDVSADDFKGYYNEGQTYLLFDGKFILADENGGLGAHKCLLVLNGTNNAPVLSISEEITSLTPIPSPKGEGREYFYTLDGRKLNGKPTKKGLYIHNGRKVVIK